MTRKIFRLCLTLALACCLSAPGANAQAPDDEAAALRARAEAGEAPAQFELGRSIADPDEDEDEEFYAEEDGEEAKAAPRNYEEAAVWYRKAAEQGHAGAMIKMGRLCEEGLGLPLNRKEAAAWYEKALARLGDDADGELKQEAEYGLTRARLNVAFKHFRRCAGGCCLDIDYPVDGEPGALAAMRRVVDGMIDDLQLSRGLGVAPGTRRPGDIEGQLELLTGELRECAETERALDRGDDCMHANCGQTIRVVSQDKATVTFMVEDTIYVNGSPYAYNHMVRISDGKPVTSAEIFVLPGVRPPFVLPGEWPPVPKDGREAKIDKGAVFAAYAFGARLGSWGEGLFNADDEAALAFDPDLEYRSLRGDAWEESWKGHGLGLHVTWADLAPYLTARGRELFAEHLPEKAEDAPAARPDQPEFPRVEKTIGVKRGKGAKQGAAKVKAVVDWPEGGEPKATAALRKGIDALLAQCAADKGVAKASLELRYRDPRLVTYECKTWKREKYEGMAYFAPADSFVATLSAADGRRIGIADLAEVTDERWRELLRNLMSGSGEKELSAYPAPAQTAVALLYDGLKIEDLRKGKEGMDFWRKLPYEDLDPHLTPAGKALLGRHDDAGEDDEAEEGPHDAYMPSEPGRSMGTGLTAEELSGFKLTPEERERAMEAYYETLQNSAAWQALRDQVVLPDHSKKRKERTQSGKP